MAVVLVRIDDRLIHGQVIEGWLKAIRANQIVVVSDEAASDEFQKALMQMAVPEDVKVLIVGVEEASSLLREKAPASLRTILLLPGPREALALIERGVLLESINVGGMHYMSGKEQVTRTVSLSVEDRTLLRALLDKGILLEGRALPTDESVDFRRIVEAR